MADKDTITKDYMQDSEHFADAFNFLLYGGRQVIKPEQLKPLDTTSIVLPYGTESKTVPIQKYRDVLKMVTAMEDDKAAYLLLGIENQSDIHYAMPIRNMLYDAIQYVNQVDEISKEHRKSKKMPETKAEYLSGFYKTDKIIPVITVTLYFGADDWDAPRDLHGMLTADEDILRFVDNYHLHLIAPAEIEDEDFAKFHTELSLALKYVKYSKDKKKLRAIVNEDTAFRSVSRKTADMVNVVTNSDLHYDNGEERVDMCEAIEGIRNDAKAEGIEEGILKTLISLVKDGILTIADAAKRANMTVSEFEDKTGLKA
ncbi:MAG: Rpn family recombination-promoting nuclease/putative transposase [Ruminococcus sp.]|nr:Rpn family recombination-promoting nuclease/putative transposase [Ruminococcus sp.]